MIDIQEPKLAVHLDGPAEVLYGRKELFKLKVSNTGTGQAENVQITLIPVGTTENRPVSHRMASLAAGEERVMEVELTAHETGILTIQIEAKAEGGAHAELANKVLVRRAALAVATDGPAMQYVGAATTYRIVMQNPGNAAAKHVKLSVSIPPGTKYISSSDGGRLTGNQVQWLLESLDPGIERAFLLKCNLGLPGDLRLEVNSTADEELAASASAVTHVDTLANLRLEVKEPDGPVPVGEETVYELRIRNRGTRNATGVEVVSYFSSGIEPTTATGAAYRITPGQVTFEPIPSLLAGDEVTLKIHARAKPPATTSSAPKSAACRSGPVWPASRPHSSISRGRRRLASQVNTHLPLERPIGAAPCRDRSRQYSQRRFPRRRRAAHSRHRFNSP